MTKLHTTKLWFDKGQMVEVTDDVLDIVKQIRDISERVNVYYNDQKNHFDIVEQVSPVEEKLIFSADALDQRVLDRLRAADHWYGRDVPEHILGDDEDFAAMIDASNDALEAAKTEKFREGIREAGERLAWALDICSDQSSVGGSILVPRSLNGSDDS